MSEPLSAQPDLARLDELAALTRDYARFSRSWSGFANSAAGAWLLVAVAILRGGHVATADLFVVLAPVAWLVVLPLARAHYQRRGIVVERDPDPVPLPVRVLVSAALTIPLRLLLWDGRSHGLLAIEIALLVAMPALAVALRRRLGDVTGMTGFLSPATLPIDVSVSWKWAILAYAVLAITTGAWQHWVWRRVDHRLGALREGA